MWLKRDGVLVRQDPTPFRIRSQEFKTSEGGRVTPRYYFPDVDAMLITPSVDQPVILTRTFHREKSNGRKP